MQAACKTLHDARYLAEPHDGAVGDVSDVGLAEERQQMVLAKGVYFDVLHDDDLFVVFVKEGALQNGLGVLSIAVGEEVHGLGCAHGGLEESLAAGIFAHVEENAAIGVGHHLHLLLFQRSNGVGILELMENPVLLMVLENYLKNCNLKNLQILIILQ